MDTTVTSCYVLTATRYYKIDTPQPIAKEPITSTKGTIHHIYR